MRSDISALSSPLVGARATFWLLARGDPGRVAHLIHERRHSDTTVSPRNAGPAVGGLPDGAAADRDAGPGERDEDPGEHHGSDALAVARESLEEADHGEDRGDDRKA